MDSDARTRGPKHLYRPDEVARASGAPAPDGGIRRRPRGEGNGVRLHLILFAAMSVAVLVLVIALIAAVTRMM